MSFDTSRSSGAPLQSIDPALVSELTSRRDDALMSRIDAKASFGPKTEEKAPASETAKATGPRKDGQRADDRATETQTAAAKKKLAAGGLTDIHLRESTVYYGQGDQRWAAYQYPKQGLQHVDRQLKDAGCAPTALAMADATVKGSETTPVDVADFAVKNGYSGKASVHGSLTDDLVHAWAAENGLQVTKANDVDTLRAGLAEGAVAIISVGPGNFTRNGHIMVLNGYATEAKGASEPGTRPAGGEANAEKNWYFVTNSGTQFPTQRRYDSSEVVVDPSLHHGAGKVRVSEETLSKELKYGYLITKKD